MAGFNFYMERQRPGQVREPGYIRASLQVDRPSARDDRAPFTNEQYRDDPAARRQLIDKHIGIVRNMLANRNPPVIMDEQAAARAHDMGMRAHTTNPDTIAQTVLSAVTTNLPSAEQQALRTQLAANNTDENQYYAALGRVGAGYNNIATLMAAYRDIMARESGSGNMMNGVGNTGSYPGYGGVALNNGLAVYNYANANYGLNRDVSSQLYNIGVRSTAQVQQVMRHVDEVSSGVASRMGVQLTEAEQRIIRNGTAVPTARLAALAGDRMPQHQANTIRDTEENTRLQLERDKAVAANDTAAIARVDQQIRENDARAERARAAASRSEAERNAAAERDRASRASHLQVFRARPELRNNVAVDRRAELTEPERRQEQVLGSNVVATATRRVENGTLEQNRSDIEQDVAALLASPAPARQAQAPNEPGRVQVAQGPTPPEPAAPAAPAAQAPQADPPKATQTATAPNPAPAAAATQQVAQNTTTRRPSGPTASA